MGDVGAASWRALQLCDDGAGDYEGVCRDPESGLANAQLIAAQRNDGSVCGCRGDGVARNLRLAHQSDGEIFACDAEVKFEAAG